MSVRPRLPRAPRGSAAAGTPLPVIFFPSVQHTAANTNRLEQPGNWRPLGPVKGPGGTCRPHPPGAPCPTQRGRHRPLPPPGGRSGSCGGGEVVARRRAPPRQALRAGLCAPRARNTWPRGLECAPALETWRPLALAPPGRAPVGLQSFWASGRPAASLAGLDARAYVSVFGGQSPAGGRHEVHGALAVPAGEAFGDAFHRGI